MKPAEKYGLTERARIDGWVIYSDELHTWAVDEFDWVQDAHQDNYTEWCDDALDCQDRDECARLAGRARIKGMHVGGTGEWVDAVPSGAEKVANLLEDGEWETRMGCNLAGACTESGARMDRDFASRHGYDSAYVFPDGSAIYTKGLTWDTHDAAEVAGDD